MKKAIQERQPVFWFLIALLCSVIILPQASHSSAKSTNQFEPQFNSYMDGALSVYAQFKSPSIKESEQFYAFVKSRWAVSSCVTSCNSDGYSTGMEYVHKKRIELE